MLRQALKDCVKVVVGDDGFSRIEVSQNMVTSPALKVPASAFSGVLSPDDVELEVLPSTLMHPAAINYFFRRRNTVDDFNAKVCHPAFFNSDYERFSTRHSTNASNLCREMTNFRAAGVVYRLANNIKYKGDVIDLIDTPPKCTKCQCFLYAHLYESRIPTGHKKIHSVLDDGICQSCNETPPPIEVIDDEKLIGRLCILAITLYGLKSQSLFTANSPSIIATCGLARRTTDISWHSGIYISSSFSLSLSLLPLISPLSIGEFAQWSDLEWPFVLKHASSVNLEVNSGYSVGTVNIGAFSMTGHTIIDTPIDVFGECEIVGPIMKGKKPMGQVSHLFIPLSFCISYIFLPISCSLYI